LDIVDKDIIGELKDISVGTISPAGDIIISKSL
jgi:hypothetical protein